MAMKNTRKKPSLALRFIYIVALIFLCVGLCVLGSFRGTGDSFELKTQGTGDAEMPSVIFRLSNPTVTNDDGTTSTAYLRLRHVYVNVGAAYTDAGEAVTLRAEVIPSATSSASSSSGRRLDLEFSNFSAPEGGEEGEEGAEDVLPSEIYYNWVEIGSPATGWLVSTYSYVRLTARTCNTLVNEIVFVGERLRANSSTAAGTGEYYLIPAEVYSATALVGESSDEAVQRAQALIDSQYMPSTDNSYFNNVTGSEMISLMTIAEMRAGGSYGEGNVYEGERVYGALGEDILALGTLIFGNSPFGLRFFPMLAAAGALLVGALLVRRVTKSDRAGLIFAVLFALASATLALGGLGTPLMLGVFFFLLSLDMCHRFYANGMKNADFASALPLLVSGLAGAFAILIHGAFIVPVAGVAALFGLGLVRLRRARRYHLDLAIADAEAQQAQEERAAAHAARAASAAPAQEGQLSPARRKVAFIAREYSNKTAIASVAFGCSLVIGAIVFALLFALPLYYPYVKLYSDPAAPSVNIFGLAARSFAGGFTGVSAAAPASSAWNIFYLLGRADGAAFSSVFGAFMNPVAILAALAGLAYLIYTIVRLVRAKAWGKSERILLRRTAIPFAGLVLALVTAAFAKDAVLFVLLAWLFLFMLAANAVADFTAREGKTGSACRTVMWVGFGLLAALFVLYFVFAAGFPVSSGVIAAIFG